MLLAVAGCGGGGPEPRLPPELAASLAARADSVASLLAEGDACGARSEAQELRRETIEALNTGRIPAALQEETVGAGSELVESIGCGTDASAPPPAAAERLAERFRELAG